MHRRLRLVIVVTVLFGSGLIGLPVASPQDEQVKRPPLVDITSTEFGAGNTVGEPTSTFSEPLTPTISEDPQGRSSVIKWEPDAPLQAPITPRRSRLLAALYVSRMARYSCSTLVRPCAQSDRTVRVRLIHSFNPLSLTPVFS